MNWDGSGFQIAKSATGRTAPASPVNVRRRRCGSALGAVAVCAVLLAGCTSTTLRHGHLLNPGDLQQVQPGMTEDAVRSALGTPDTTSALPGGNAFYYISSTRKQAAFFKPEEVDRKVVAIYFNQVGSVSQVAQYGMKDGRVFDYVKGETPAYMRDKGFIAKFFRGIGPKQKLFNE